MKLHIGQLCIFLVIIFSGNITIAFAQRPQKETLPFTLNISCNNDYCDIAPSAGTSTAGYQMILKDGILGTKKGIIYYCLSRNGEHDTLFIISIKGNQKNVLNKIPFKNIDLGKFSIDPGGAIFYAQLQRFNYLFRQPSAIDTTSINKSLLAENTILALSANDFKILDTVRSSACHNYSFSLNGSILSTVAINGIISKCKWDTPLGGARLDTTKPNVFYIDGKPALLSNGDLIAYDICKKELLSIPISTNKLCYNNVGSRLGYNIVGNSDTGMYISLTYNDEVKIKDSRRLAILRKELVYYDKKFKTVKILSSLKCRPVKYAIKRDNGSYSGMVFSNELLQENDKYMVYSVLGIDTGIHESTGYEKKVFQKDSLGNTVDSVYQSVNYNKYFTVNAILSKKTGKVLYKKTYKGFTILRNSENLDPSKDAKVWAIDKDLGTDYIARIFYENNRLIAIIDEPNQKAYPEKLIYRVYKN